MKELVKFLVRSVSYVQLYMNHFSIKLVLDIYNTARQ